MLFPQRSYTGDGRLRGSYVYFLCCSGQEPGHAYVKLGTTDIPTQRMLALVRQCSLKPLTFGTCHVRSRLHASLIECELHRAYAPWRIPSEWYRFAAADKPLFASRRKEILSGFSHPSWPLSTEVCPVISAVKHARSRADNYHRAMRRSMVEA